MRAKKISSLFHTLFQESCSCCSVIKQQLRDVHLCHKAKKRALVEQHKDVTTFALGAAQRWRRQPRSLLAQIRQLLATRTRPITCARSWQQRSPCDVVGTPEKRSLQQTMKPTRQWRAQLEARDVCVASLKAELATAANNQL